MALLNRLMEFQMVLQYKLFLNTDKGKYTITIFEDIKKAKVTKYLKLMNFFQKRTVCQRL